MKIRGKEVQVDVRYELEQFAWQQANWTEDGVRLICCSPFRQDNHPSFWVRLKSEGDYEAGLWSDSGSDDAEYQKGHFVKLYAFLKGVDIETAEDMLLEQYHTERTELKWKTPLFQKKKTTTVDSSLLDEFSDTNTYLHNRGISNAVINQFRVGYSDERKAIAIPWFKSDGSLGNIKYRKTTDKHFWYAKGGLPIREMIWGLDIILRKQHRTAILCESEIDAMTSWTYGVPALALGGSAFTDKRKEMLLRSPINHLVLAFDNDEVGERIRKTVSDSLRNEIKISYLRIPSPYKDLNDIPDKETFIRLCKEVHTPSSRFSLKKHKKI